MRALIFIFATFSLLNASAQTVEWPLINFAQRLELEVANPSDRPVETLAVVPVAEASQVALRFPGTLAVVVLPGDLLTVLPSQSDDLDGDGNPDELVFLMKLAARETRTVHVYYSTTLRDTIPYAKRVHASHAYGFNRATAALESEVIGYRSYGGFFLDIQARTRPGLYNGLVGYFGARAVGTLGRDVIHLGDTLGLGGLFLRKDGQAFRPPLNMPDYAHKPEAPGAPRYRVVADGPVRAIVEQRIDRWGFGGDAAQIVARYSMGAGDGHVDCRFRIVPLVLSGSYEVGTGIRHLPQMKLDAARGRLALEGLQDKRIGPLALALYYDPGTARAGEPLATREERNECVVFHARLEPGKAVEGRYQVAGAWSGSGIPDLLGYLRELEPKARAEVEVGKFRFTPTPVPQKVEGESD